MYRIESKTDEIEMIQILEDKIYEYNSEAIQQYDGHLFSKVVKDENGEVIAGVGGWTWAGACEITQLWVNRTFRRKGIGNMLLDAASQEAKSNGCMTILIKTYSFQAPAFYMKNGYRIKHALDSFPRGYVYYTLTKELR
jgi:GNAT superfamily N-acetyltransferase